MVKAVATANIICFRGNMRDPGNFSYVSVFSQGVIVANKLTEHLPENLGDGEPHVLASAQENGCTETGS